MFVTPSFISVFFIFTYAYVKKNNAISLCSRVTSGNTPVLRKA